jgi:hypothetical protein
VSGFILIFPEFADARDPGRRTIRLSVVDEMLLGEQLDDLAPHTDITGRVRRSPPVAGRSRPMMRLPASRIAATCILPWARIPHPAMVSLTKMNS